MNAKLSKIDELSKLLSDKDSLSRDLISLCKHFRMGKIMGGCGIIKEKGVPSTVLMLFLLIIRICSTSKFQLYLNKYFGLLDEAIGKNCIYRFVNNPKYNWRSLLYGVVKSFLRIVSKESADKDNSKDDGRLHFFVMDDTTLEKFGKAMENISRVFDHVCHKYILGYKLLTLSFFDGKSLLPADFSLHAEKGKKGTYGLSAKERRNRFSKRRDARSAGAKRNKECDMSKLDVAIEMIRRAWKHGLRANYFLADSWFDSTDFIRKIREIADGAIHVICMAKNGTRKYKYNGFMHTAKDLIVLNERKATTQCRKYHCNYIKLDVELDGMDVRLFLVHYGHKDNWNILLTTDRSLGFTKVFELYQIRWTTEVMYRECKQYLGLGQCQSNDFDAQIADCTLVFITYIIMAVRKRFGEYETMGVLFASMKAELSELTLWHRILPIVEKLLKELCDLFDVDYVETMRKISRDQYQECKILRILNTLDDGNAEYKPTGTDD